MSRPPSNPITYGSPGERQHQRTDQMHAVDDWHANGDRFTEASREQMRRAAIARAVQTEDEWLRKLGRQSCERLAERGDVAARYALMGFDILSHEAVRMTHGYGARDIVRMPRCPNRYCRSGINVPYSWREEPSECRTCKGKGHLSLAEWRYHDRRAS